MLRIASTWGSHERQQSNSIPELHTNRGCFNRTNLARDKSSMGCIQWTTQLGRIYMRNILLTFFATTTLFLSVASVMQANGKMVINPTYVSQADQDNLTAFLTAQQVQGE